MKEFKIVLKAGIYDRPFCLTKNFQQFKSQFIEDISLSSLLREFLSDFLKVKLFISFHKDICLEEKLILKEDVIITNEDFENWKFLNKFENKNNRVNLKVDFNGNIGFGTTSPSTILHIL